MSINRKQISSAFQDIWDKGENIMIDTILQSEPLHSIIIGSGEALGGLLAQLLGPLVANLMG